jgi:hypothetical protein
MFQNLQITDKDAIYNFTLKNLNKSKNTPLDIVWILQLQIQWMNQIQCRKPWKNETFFLLIRESLQIKWTNIQPKTACNISRVFSPWTHHIHFTWASLTKVTSSARADGDRRCFSCSASISGDPWGVAVERESTNSSSANRHQRGNTKGYIINIWTR